MKANRSRVLKGRGFEEGEAYRLIALLPIAFSRPVLEELGVKTFVTNVTAVGRKGEEVTADLLRQPEYVVGLKVARKHRRIGLMNHAAYERITESSADIDAASKALNSGADMHGAAIASALLGTEIARHLIR